MTWRRLPSHESLRPTRSDSGHRRTLGQGEEHRPPILAVVEPPHVLVDVARQVLARDRAVSANDAALHVDQKDSIVCRCTSPLT